MASEEPLFGPSLKKRKKKQVAFTEDPLGADADPTAPAPETIDNTTANGDAVDLGPATAHERMKLNGDAEGAGEKKEDEEFKAMFGDMKKKKKKKEIPMEFVSGIHSTSCHCLVEPRPMVRAMTLAHPHQQLHPPLHPLLLLLLPQQQQRISTSPTSRRRRNPPRKRQHSI
jgi:hypothetical protein